MQYSNPLPSIRKLNRLAEWDGPFPMKGSRIIIGAERYGFDDDTIRFLKLFPDDTVFRSRDDFQDRCKKLQTLIRKKRERSDSRFRNPLNKLLLIRLFLHAISSGAKRADFYDSHVVLSNHKAAVSRAYKANKSSSQPQHFSRMRLQEKRSRLMSFPLGHTDA